MDVAGEIGLDSNWPQPISDTNVLEIRDHVEWAIGYFRAAESLYLESAMGNHSAFTLAGPCMQLVGLAAELTFKCLLRGSGKSEGEIRSYGHGIHKAFFDAQASYAYKKFGRLLFDEKYQLALPSEVIIELTPMVDRADDGVIWRAFSSQLTALDRVYDRPFQTRYIAPGELNVPEPYLVLVGTKIILQAMRERTGTFVSA